MINEEDEAFNDIERQAQQRKEAVKAALRRASDDDDTQVYLRPWVGLTDEDRYEFAAAQYSWEELLIAAEAKLKEKNT